MKRNGLEVTDEMNRVMTEQESQGQTAIMCAIDGAYGSCCFISVCESDSVPLQFVPMLRSTDRIVAMVSVADTVKPEAHLAMYTLRKMGLDVMLLTGDNRKTARAIAAQVG